MKENFYPDLDPVKVICILDFDSTQVAHELANRDEIVVHCNIREQQSQIITSELQSWTFVVLPRFLKLLTSMPTPLDFKGDCLKAWLYFMTRKDREQVEITSGIISGTNEIADAYNRLSNLSEDEKKILRNRLEAEISAAMSVAGARDEILEEGFEKGLQEGLEKGLEEGLEKGRKAYKVAIQMLRDQYEAGQVCDKTGLTLEEVEELRRDFSPGHRQPDAKRFRLAEDAGQGPDDKPMDDRIAQ